MNHQAGEPLAPIASELLKVIGISEHFTASAALLLAGGLQRIEKSVLLQEAKAGLGESLVFAYYQSLALHSSQKQRLTTVTELLLRYRFLCAFHGVYDDRSHEAWFLHGLDQEIQESEILHQSTQLETSHQVDQFCFGNQLANYFGMESQRDGMSRASDESIYVGKESLGGGLWHLQIAANQPHDGYHAYLLIPHPFIAIVGEMRLFHLVAEVTPLLKKLSHKKDSLICAPLSTRKVSISKPGFHSFSTYFDSRKPVPFSLNRGIDAYLLLSPKPLTRPSEFLLVDSCYGPVIDSMSTLVFRDPADYQLGDGAFLHKAMESPVQETLVGADRTASLLSPKSTRSCLVEGLLVQSEMAGFSLTPCQHLSDRYAIVRGLSGHGPSGVMNQSLLATQETVVSTWRYERNFDSWSGRRADVGRHPSINFLGWEQPASGSLADPKRLQVKPLVYIGYPSECKIEDLRLFAYQGNIYAIGAVILSRTRYQKWLPKISTNAAANNTIDDMLVVQALGRLDPEQGVIHFEGLPILHRLSEHHQNTSQLPSGFEKNWLIHEKDNQAYLFYSVQPWQVFRADSSLLDWHQVHHKTLNLPAALNCPIRNSAHPFMLHDGKEERGLAMIVHRRRLGSYIYDQFLMTISSESLEPMSISREPILSVNTQALAKDHGFRKNEGVCYVSSVLVQREEVRIFFNLFDCRTCVITVNMKDLINLIDNDELFHSLVP
ncbi:hypothetical protein [Synechococcus sp. CCY 0621]|uniref:hypothetical protein n=1 Tax=Synechococcus sp. CCY 0621 TaxID=2815603 RepID=UPI001C23CD80|nr:hypothetical protein [Synechococcus sp. CCY 0621]